MDAAIKVYRKSHQHLELRAVFTVERDILYVLYKYAFPLLPYKLGDYLALIPEIRWLNNKTQNYASVIIILILSSGILLK